jgi:lipid II:glycine glycyltransferase (peptidoglycan interpeptide bridge formation enzyme)
MTFRPAVAGDEPAWQALLGRVPSGDFLHDWGWAQVAAFDGQPQRRFVLEEAGEVVALAAAQVRPMGMGRSFWYVPHGPVLDYAAEASRDQLALVLRGLTAAARAGGGVVIRLEPRIEADSHDAALFDGLATPVEHRLQVGQTRVVPLADDEPMLAAFDADTRWAVRRTIREGLDTRIVSDASDMAAVDRLHDLVTATQRRAGFPLPALERYRRAWAGLAGAGRACLVEGWWNDEILASGLLVTEGGQSFYLFAGSRRELPGEPKRYASYAVQWAILREARARGSRLHDLWGVAPAGAGPDHRWAGVGLFKRGFGGREIRWAGSWEIVVAPMAYRLRSALGRLRRRGQEASE